MRNLTPGPTDHSHHRRRHVRHQSDGTVTPVRDATVKNRGRKADGSSRNTSNRGALANMVTSDDDFDADDVVFAFEYPEWSSHGFRRADAFLWESADVAVGEAARWRDAGFSFEEAIRWRQLPQTKNPLLTPEDAATYRDAGVEPHAGLRWTPCHHIPADDAIKWMSENITPATAEMWRKFGADHGIFKDWQELGVTNIHEASVLSELGHDRITMWTEAGVPLDRIPSMLVWESFQKFGYDHHDIAVLAESPYDRMALIEWASAGIPADQIAEFLEKGYTPKRAARQIARSETSATVEDLRRGEPVPGGSWKTIRETIELWANEENFDVSLRDVRHKDGGVEVRMIIRDRDDTMGVARAAYTFLFTSTGKFIRGSSPAFRERTVKGFLTAAVGQQSAPRSKSAWLRRHDE